MPLGEIISALMKRVVNEDSLLIVKSIWNIEIYNNEKIRICFLDGNTRDIAINADGEEVSWYD